MRTEDGCDVDNDFGLQYAATKEKMVLFVELQEQPPASPAVDLKPWPRVYPLPPMPITLIDQIQKRKSSEEAVILRCNSNFCSTFLGIIAEDVERYIGTDL